jgi:hypothetical protein
MLRPVARAARMATGFLRKPIPAYTRGRRYKKKKQNPA